MVLDLGSGAGLDSIIAGWQVGATGRVIGVDLNPTMCRKAEAHAAASGVRMVCHEGAGFTRVRSTVVPGFGFRKESTRDAAEAYGVKAVLFTAQRPAT